MFVWLGGWCCILLFWGCLRVHFCGIFVGVYGSLDLEILMYRYLVGVKTGIGELGCIYMCFFVGGYIYILSSFFSFSMIMCVRTILCCVRII